VQKSKESMVLDINLLRKDKGGDPDLVKESQRRRFASVELVDEIVKLDHEWREDRHKLDKMLGDHGRISKEIGKIFKTQKDKAKAEEAVKPLKEQSIKMKEDAERAQKALDAKEKILQAKLNLIGNIVHESVPVSKNENDNTLLKQWGELKVNPTARRHHHELLWMIDGYDPERGAKVAGHRGYFLKGIGVRLNRALIDFGLDFLLQRNYTLLQVPLFMNKDAMAATAQLSDFDDQLYKIQGHDDEKYLIATSEQPISAFHSGEWLEEKELPLRYAGVSNCFRKEAGAYGKDTWGIFRVHQFEKIEQFCVTTPETSWEEHERMLKISEEFYQTLGLAYRVVVIVSGELNNAAAKKYDLEAWFPAFEEFRELVSCSNCTDYQARSLEIRCGIRKKGERAKRYAHMLNSTLTATTRTLCCILENYQTEKGIQIPKPLQPYLGGLEFVPFVQSPPKFSPEKNPAQPEKDDGDTQQKGKEADKKKAK